MNFAAHGLHKTWPQGTVRTALTVLVRVLLQAGHIRFGGSVVALVLGEVLKLIPTRDLRDRLCFVSGDDAGQRGDSFGGLAS